MSTEMEIDSVTQEFSTIVHALRAETLMRALAVINSRARYRFTGLYRVDGRMLRNVALFDRENPGGNAHGDVCPVSDSYCSIVAATARPFMTFDARSDERLTRHLARAAMVSYAGVPVVSAEASGTLCHFDSRPRIIPNGELEFMESIASALSPFLGRSAWSFKQ